MSNSILLEQTAEARDHDTWNARMAGALAPRTCCVIQSTSDEAPGLLAYVAQHLGVHHSPDLLHVQHALSKAVSAPLAATQRAAHHSVVKAEERLTRMHEHLKRADDRADDALDRRGTGRPPPSAARLALGQQEGDAARHAYQRLSAQLETVSQRIRAIGHAYHCVDLERGVRRHGTLIARDIQSHIATMRAVAQHAHLSQACMDRIATAERVVPTMQATMAFVSGSVRQQVQRLE